MMNKDTTNKEKKSSGWVKLYRSLMAKAFYKTDSEAVHLWVHLLMKASHEGHEGKLGGKTISVRPGQLITGRKQLSIETGISESKIERLNNQFEKIEQQIEQRKTTTNRLISITNWNNYQKVNNELNNKTPKSEHNTRSIKNTYIQEIEKNSIGINIERYKFIMEYLFGENELKRPFNNVLSIKEQLTYEQFCTLLDKSEKAGVTIISLLQSLENDPKYAKGKTSLYLILNTWINKDKRDHERQDRHKNRLPGQ